MPFVCGELSSIVRFRIVKPDIRDEATSTTRLLAVKYNFKEPANCLRPQKCDAGYLAGASTKELLREKEISEGALLHFRKRNWLHLYHAVISKMIEKTSIGYAFARRFACLDPVRIATSTTQVASQFKLVIDH